MRDSLFRPASQLLLETFTWMEALDDSQESCPESLLPACYVGVDQCFYFRFPTVGTSNDFHDKSISDRAKAREARFVFESGRNTSKDGLQMEWFSKKRERNYFRKRRKRNYPQQTDKRGNKNTGVGPHTFVPTAGSQKDSMPLTCRAL